MTNIIFIIIDGNNFVFSGVSGKEPKIPPNMCVFGITMELEATIRSWLVLFSFLYTLSVVFLLGFVLVFFIVEI